MGSKKVLTADEQRQRENVEIRLKTLKREFGLTAKELASKLCIGESSMRGYIKGRQALPERVAANLSSMYGKIPPYWMGLTDCESWTAYEQERERAESTAMDEYETALRTERANRAAFFKMCGYRYEDMSGQPRYDFEDVAANGATPSGGPHILTDLQHSDAQPVHFSTEELVALIGRIRGLIKLECVYQQERKGMPHGND